MFLSGAGIIFTENRLISGYLKRDKGSLLTMTDAGFVLSIWKSLRWIRGRIESRDRQNSTVYVSQIAATKDLALYRFFFSVKNGLLNESREILYYLLRAFQSLDYSKSCVQWKTELMLTAAEFKQINSSFPLVLDLKFTQEMDSCFWYGNFRHTKTFRR